MTITHDFPPTWIRRIAGMLRAAPDGNQYQRVLYRMEDFRWRWYMRRHGPNVDPEQIMEDVGMFRVAFENELQRQDRAGEPIPKWTGPVERDDDDWPEPPSQAFH